MVSFFLLGPRKALLAVIGILAGFIAWSIISSEPTAPPVEPARVRAWEKIETRLREADQHGAEAGDRHLQRIKDFFAERRGRTGAYADDLLGWGGKWAYVKGFFSGDNGAGHREHMRQCFARHIFGDREVQELLQSVITAYLSELEGDENALLVQIQADLSEQDLPALRALVSPGNNEVFRGEYRTMVDRVAPVIGRDLAVTAGREVVVWIASDIATAVTVRLASAAAVRLGISGGILGTGAASGAATLGIGLVIGFAVDGAVDWAMKKAGYDPAGDIAREVSNTLTRMEGLIVDGDPEANAVFQKLRQLQRDDYFSFVRDECRQNADRIEATGVLGLRQELNRLNGVHVRLREAALKKLILEGGKS